MDAIYSNNFMLEILDETGPIEKIIYNNSNYYSLPDGARYKLRLTNNNNVRADAHVWVDGIKVGVWRINGNSQLIIRRSLNSIDEFTFIRDGLVDTMSARIRRGGKDNGLVRVTFRPEKSSYYWNPRKPHHRNEMIVPQCFSYTDSVTPYIKEHQKCIMNSDNFARYTNTNLSGHIEDRTYRYGYNDHKPNRVVPLTDIDYENITTIYTRLIVDNDKTSYRRKYMMLREAENTSRPPPRISLDHPNRPHNCSRDSKFKLSRRTFYFDNF